MATAQQIQQDIQNELATSNQLLRLISLELQKIKLITRRGGEFDTTLDQDTIYIRQHIQLHIDRSCSVALEGDIQTKALPNRENLGTGKFKVVWAEKIENESLMKTLASMQQIDLDNLPPVPRMHIDLNNSNSNQNLSYEQHETFREDSNMDDSQ